MKRVVFLLHLILFAFIIKTYAQISVTPTRVVPKTPEAASYDQYINFPVSMATGVPDISIPIYTISINGYELPISVSYHASGIRVNDIATPVGLGWVLNAGGIISRNIIGVPDEGGVSEGWFEVTEAEENACEDDILEQFYSGNKDTSPDLYSYSPDLSDLVRSKNF